VACLGDSWISDYERGEHADYWKLESHLPEAFLERLEAESDRDVEFVIAGFPGFTSARLLQLAKLCRLRDMARVHERRGVHLPASGSLKTALWQLGIPCAWADSESQEEDVDLVLIVAGYNDLKYGEGGPDAVARRLLQLRRLYASRGVEAVLVTIGEGAPDVEARRRRANRRLLADAEAGVVSCDDFVRGLGREMWANMEHFTPEGYRALGSMLGASAAQRLREGTLCSPDSAPRRREWDESWWDEVERSCGGTSSCLSKKRRCSQPAMEWPCKRAKSGWERSSWAGRS